MANTADTVIALNDNPADIADIADTADIADIADTADIQCLHSPD